VLHIYYLTTARIPGERAHSIQILKTCDAIRCLDVDTMLLAPRRKNPFEKKVQNMREFYGLQYEPLMMKLPTLDTLGKIRNEALSFALINITFFISSLFFLFCSINLIHQKGKKLLFIREPWLLFLFAISYPIHRIPIVYEVHDGFRNTTFKLSLRTHNAIIKIITVNQYQKRSILGLMPRLEAKVIVIPHSFDLKMFRGLPEDKIVLRRMLRLPIEPKIVMYSGQLSTWKKPEFLIKAITRVDTKLKEQVFLVFVGGNYTDIQRLRTYADSLGVKNICFSGFVPPSKVPLYLKSADILVHYSPTMDSEHVSPTALKIFEYMAAKRPVLAPHGMEIVKDGANILLFDPTSPEDLAFKIETLLNDPILQERLSTNAFKDVMEYTYEKRAKKILNTIAEALK